MAPLVAPPVDGVWRQFQTASFLVKPRIDALSGNSAFPRGKILRRVGFQYGRCSAVHVRFGSEALGASTRPRPLAAGNASL